MSECPAGGEGLLSASWGGIVQTEGTAGAFCVEKQQRGQCERGTEGLGRSGDEVRETREGRGWRMLTDHCEDMGLQFLICVRWEPSIEGFEQQG